MNTLIEFEKALPAEERSTLPFDFASKASMVFEQLKAFVGTEPQWGELELEAKVYSIWHHFFREFKQQA